MSTELLPAAVYARISDPDDERTASIETQIESAAKAAEAQGFRVDRSYADRYSGTELWERPALTELLEHAKEGRYRAVFIHALDRPSLASTSSPSSG